MEKINFREKIQTTIFQKHYIESIMNRNENLKYFIDCIRNFYDKNRWRQGIYICCIVNFYQCYKTLSTIKLFFPTDFESNKFKFWTSKIELKHFFLEDFASNIMRAILQTVETKVYNFTEMHTIL